MGRSEGLRQEEGEGEREKKWAELFQQFDTNKDGQVDIKELGEGLRSMGIVIGGDSEQEILRSGDTNRDGQLDLTEFTEYLRQHERKLKLMFNSLDRNHDGEIDASEVQQALLNLGITITLKQAEKILLSMDKDGTITVDWTEFRDHFIFNPLSKMEEIVEHWKHSTSFTCFDGDGVRLTWKPASAFHVVFLISSINFNSTEQACIRKVLLYISHVILLRVFMSAANVRLFH